MEASWEEEMMNVVHLRGFESALAPGHWLAACAPFRTSMLTDQRESVTCPACRQTMLWSTYGMDLVAEPLIA